MLTRRRLLLAGGVTLGTVGGGALYVNRELQGDTGGYVAPDDAPTITTRGTFDDDGRRQSDADADTPAAQTDGEWDGLEDATDLFVFIHGFDTGDEAARNQAYTAQLGLEETPLPAPVVGYSWDADRDWDVAKSVADENGQLLAAWLLEWTETHPDQSVHLLAYSLGARLTGHALLALTDEGHTDRLASVSLLGGAIPHDSVETDGYYGEALEAAARVHNFHSRNDRVLGWVYRLSDRTRAVGYDGIRDPAAAPEPYRDEDVTDLVADHYSYFQPEEGCLPRVVETLDHGP